MTPYRTPIAAYREAALRQTADTPIGEGSCRRSPASRFPGRGAGAAVRDDAYLRTRTRAPRRKAAVARAGGEAHLKPLRQRPTICRSMIGREHTLRCAGRAFETEQHAVARPAVTRGSRQPPSSSGDFFTQLTGPTLAPAAGPPARKRAGDAGKSPNGRAQPEQAGSCSLLCAPVRKNQKWFLALRAAERSSFRLIVSDVKENQENYQRFRRCVDYRRSPSGLSKVVEAQNVE